jgi:uncharacterized protein YndB with AHSA1/START domain
MATTLAEVGDRALRMERVFDATLGELWAALTDPAAIPGWWGPAHHHPRVITMDVREGGTWRFELAGNNGAVFGFSGRYLRVDAPWLLEQTFVFDPFPEAAVTESFRLDDVGGSRTRLVVDVVHPSPEGRDAQVMNGIEAGTNEAHNRLQAVVAAQRAS